MSERQISRQDTADWMSGRGGGAGRGGRDLELSIIHRRLKLNRVVLNQVRKKFCVEDEENWAQHRTLWHTIGKAWDLRDVVIDDDWLCSICQIRRKPGECSFGDAMHVLESVKKYAVVNCVKGSWKIQECQKRNIAGVKCKKDVICYQRFKSVFGGNKVQSGKAPK